MKKILVLALALAMSPVIMAKSVNHSTKGHSVQKALTPSPPTAIKPSPAAIEGQQSHTPTRLAHSVKHTGPICFDSRLALAPIAGGIDTHNTDQKQKPATFSRAGFEAYAKLGGRTYKIRTCDQRIKSPLLYQLS